MLRVLYSDMTSLNILITASLVLCFLPQITLAAHSEPYIAKAAAAQLEKERTWQVLLHYTRTLTGSEKSRIDDPDFFLAVDGGTNSRSELAANINALFIPQQAPDSHYACRFPARFAWLKSQLGLTDEQLPSYSCPERDKSIKAVDAKSAVLVFPVGHINSPASMFGHTLLRIDGSSKSTLISHAANYAATTTDSNGFLYAWRGLTGGYKGHYSLLPYYLKVKEYNDLEHRDMWEYRLDLSESEVQVIVAHLWELHKIQSSYYFVDENCSYNLLFLIEAARPSLQLVDKTGLLVLPSDTIRITIASGIVKDVSYRPSQGTRIRSLISTLDSQSQNTSYQLAHGKLAPHQLQQQEPDNEKKIRMFDLATGFLQYRYHRNELDKQTFQKQYLALLSERSLLGTANSADTITPPPAPETGHNTRLIALAGGVRDEEPFSEIRFRPSFHGLLDPDQGYLPGAQIKFMDTALRFNTHTDQLYLQTLHLLDIISVSPRNRFFKPVSWKVNTGLDREPLADGNDHLIYRLNTGAGLTWQTNTNGLLYLFAEADFNLGERLPEKAAIAPGVSIGLVEQLNSWWKLHIQARSFIFRLGDDRDATRLDVDQTFRVTQHQSIILQFRHDWVNNHRIAETSLTWNYYY